MVGLLMAAVAVAACGGGGGSESSSQGPPSTTDAVEVRTETFVDTSPGTSPRTLETLVFVPGGRGGGYPLIVFAHGSGGNPDFYRVLLEALAANGYVVAAPKLSSDRLRQPADVSFVISELLRLTSAPTGPYTGLIDGTRIGVAGHSAGGVTVLGVGFNSCCIDDRVGAGAVLAADAPPFPGGTYFAGIRTPLLVVHGLADPTVPFEAGRRIFTDASPPKWMLTVPASATPSADHARPFVGTENRPLPDTRLVMTTIVGFFDRFLHDDPDAMGRVRRAVDAELSFKLDVVER